MLISIIFSFIAVFLYYFAFESSGFKKALFVRIIVYVINFIALGKLETLSSFEIFPILIVIFILLVEILLANAIDYFVCNHAPSVKLFVLASALANMLFICLTEWF